MQFFEKCQRFLRKKHRPLARTAPVRYTFLARIGIPNTSLNGYCTRYRYSPTRTISTREKNDTKKFVYLECHTYYMQFFEKCQCFS